MAGGEVLGALIASRLQTGTTGTPRLGGAGASPLTAGAVEVLIDSLVDVGGTRGMTVIETGSGAEDGVVETLAGRGGSGEGGELEVLVS